MTLLPIKVDQILLSRKDPGVSWPIVVHAGHACTWTEAKSPHELSSSKRLRVN